MNWSTNTMSQPNRAASAVRAMTDWHDEDGHRFALDMCDHPACQAFCMNSMFVPERTGFAANIATAVNNFLGRGSTGTRVRNEALYKSGKREESK